MNVELEEIRTHLQRHPSLAWKEIRSRNEEAINSARNMIYSLKVFYFLPSSYFIDVDTFYLCLNWFRTRVSDNQKYLSGSRLYAYINTRKFKGLDSREITSLSDIEKVIYMHVISIIAENKSHAHHNTHLHTVNYTVESGLNEQHGNLFKS